ncbi:hypothetical protein [Flavobacterium aquidurense]|uniref:hypothetical protein n=1 Tax=Flavobacterium aquidurense TaxID=362413 RepID=UPI0037115302
MNELKHYILEFIIVVISLSTFYILKNYWPKYFESKGANQATKEDIGEITKIVENIKSDLSQQNELLKAQLSMTNQHKLDIKSAEREAIFDFNKQKSVWIYSLLRFSFYKYNLENFKEIGQTVLDYQKRQYEYDLAAAHLALFMYDNEFMELKSKLIIEVIELDKIVSGTTYDLYHSFMKAEINLNIEKDNIVEQSRIRYNLNEELLTIVEKHKEKAINQFESVNNLDIQMRELLFSRLKILETTTTANHC